MSEQFYFILINSLLITTGVFLLFLLYRYFIRGINEQHNKVRFIQVQQAHIDQVAGKVVFNVELPAEEKISCSLLNEEEGLLKVLVDNELKNGLTAVVIDTKSIPTGVYYFKLTTHRQQIMRKFNV